ncbi:MAG TPA: RluA family pseudouridine synthase [Rectinemataceae bacterium]
MAWADHYKREYDPASGSPPEKEPRLDMYLIVHEDADILVVDKLAPIPVQKDKSKDPDLQSILRHSVSAKRPFIEAAHRLDRRTSGIVLFAKNIQALRKLEAAFRDRLVRKTYLACLEAEPQPAQGVLVHGLRFSARSNKTIALSWTPEPVGQDENPSHGERPGHGPSPNQASKAELSYRLILKSDRYFFVEAEPRTGRHHQIRAQFSAIGCPIKGDLKYGSRRSCDSGRIMLHAYSLGFSHPRTGAPMEFTAPFPDDEELWQLLVGII